MERARGAFPHLQSAGSLLSRLGLLRPFWQDGVHGPLSQRLPASHWICSVALERVSLAARNRNGSSADRATREKREDRRGIFAPASPDRVGELRWLPRQSVLFAGAEVFGRLRLLVDDFRH